MTSPDSAAPARREAARELTGLLLVIIGLGGLLTIAYNVDPLLSYALACLLLIGGGWSMTTVKED